MKHKSVKINFIMNIALTMSTFFFQLITFPYASRILLPDGMGKVSFATSLIYYFSVFSQLGIPTYGIRACAKVRDDKEKLSKTVQELLIINLATSLIVYIVLFICVISVPRIYKDRYLICLVSSSIFLNAIGIEWFYKALEKYSYITIRSVLFKIVALIAMFFLVRDTSDYLIYGCIIVIASSLSYVLNIINARKYISFRPLGNYNFKKHLKLVGIFFAMSCATTIYVNLNTVLLGFYKSDAEVGYYDAAIKIRKILATVVTSLGVVLLPRASYYIEHNLVDNFIRITRKGLNFVFFFSVPFFVFFYLFASEGIYFLSGTAFDRAIIPMQIMMPTVVFIGLTNMMGIQILVPTNREKIVLYSEIAGAVIDIIACFALIPYYSVVGAAIGALLAEFVVLIVQWIALRNELCQSIREIHFSRMITITVLCSLVSYPIHYLNMAAFYKLIIAGSVFFGLYALLMLWKKEELAVDIFQIITRFLKITKKGNSDEK